MANIRISVAALVAAMSLAGCASAPNRTPGDPLEPMNRVVFKVNDTIDQNIAVPIAKGYQKVTPHPLRTAVSNFFSNLGDLTNIANELLQLKITDATEDLVRFAMNTTFGIGGLIDFATPARLPKHHQDFGLTLGHWGVPSGPYLVLPIFGPSSIRDSVGLAVDVRFNPLNYATEPAVRTSLYALQFVSTRSDLLGATNVLEQAALDKYSFVRDAYTQQRRARLSGSEAAPPALPNYGDEEDSGAAPAAPASGAAPASAPAAAAPASTATPASAPTAPAAPASPASSNAPTSVTPAAPASATQGQ